MLFFSLLASLGAPSIAQQMLQSDNFIGPSDTEKLQLLELNRSNQLNTARMIDDARSLSNSSSAINSLIGLSSSIPPGFTNNILWTDNHATWKLDKFGKQCAASATDYSASDPCI